MSLTTPATPDVRVPAIGPSESMVQSETYIVVLNWNGWADTIACLESLLALDRPAPIVVCDNGSTDESIARIEAWAARRAMPDTTPLEYIRLARDDVADRRRGRARLVLIDNGANLGFAGGNNVGVRFALCQPDCSRVWILNNDVTVDRRALDHLLAYCEKHPRVGICGSQVRFFDDHNRVQSAGGTLNRWYCTTHNLYCGEPVDRVPADISPVDFVPGCSMMVSRAFVENVGMMSDHYFLYFEEIDWAERGRSRFDFAICSDSIVYHRGGASIGTPSEEGERGTRAEYFLLRNRLVFGRAFYRHRLPFIYLGMLLSVGRRLVQRRWRRAYIAACAIIGRKPRVLRDSTPSAR